MSHYEVGYGKPPKSTQFKKGRSGNPKGRPKSARNKPKVSSVGPVQLENIILEEAYKAVPVQDGGRTLTLPVAQVVTRSLAMKAAAGDYRSQKLLTDLLHQIEERHRHQQEALFQEAAEYKRHRTGVLHDCEKANLPAPDPMPLPHPDDVELDIKTGEVNFRGPMTPEDQETLDGTVRHVEHMLNEIVHLKEELAKGHQPTDENGTVIEPETWAKWLADEEARLHSFMNKIQGVAEVWPRHWPPDRLRSRLPLEWRFKNLKPGSSSFKQIAQVTGTTLSDQ